MDEEHIVDKLLQKRVLTHTLFWLFVLLIAPLTSDDTITEIGESLVFRAIALPTKMAATYLLVYYQLPLLTKHRKYILFIVSLFVFSYVFTVIYRFNNIHIAEAIMGSAYEAESLIQIIGEFEYTYFGYIGKLYFFSLIFIFIKVVKSRNNAKRKIASLQHEKLSAELNFLRAQIHPHFLFNTLNNLYALTLDKSDNAPEIVAKLAEMLDYMLYQCKGDKVLLNNEVELLKNYIDLEKLRYGDRLVLNFNYKSDDKTIEIAPFILISIVENAFKHGVSGALDKAIVNVSLSVAQGIIYFKVFNTKPTLIQKDTMNYKKGIGVSNAKRQLELIYPEQYEWSVNEEKDSYEVNLIVKQ